MEGSLGALGDPCTLTLSLSNKSPPFQHTPARRRHKLVNGASNPPSIDSRIFPRGDEASIDGRIFPGDETSIDGRTNPSNPLSVDGRFGPGDGSVKSDESVAEPPQIVEKPL